MPPVSSYGHRTRREPGCTANMTNQGQNTKKREKATNVVTERTNKKTKPMKASKHWKANDPSK